MKCSVSLATLDECCGKTDWQAHALCLSGIPSEAKKKLDFAYDHQGRKIQKILATWNG